MAYENIIVDTRDDVATITLDPPDALNALNGDLLRELSGRANFLLYSRIGDAECRKAW